jgi:NAD(P)-dependent dehydrogenase (short-subunit alcohol dehydrogenase family)
MPPKIILVTGANRGIGYEIVRQLKRLGHTVILTSRDESRGRTATQRLANGSAQPLFHQLNVTDADHISRIHRFLKRRFGRLDVLINNAGISMKEDRSLPEFADDVWSSIMETNVEAPLKLARALSNLIPSGGRIINISSGGGSMTDPVGGWSPLYCVSKATLNAITRQLDFFLSKRNISVSAVCPGWVRTDMGGRTAPRSVEEGADTAVWLATTDDFPTGRFWRDRKPIPW